MGQDDHVDLETFRWLLTDDGQALLAQLPDVDLVVTGCRLRDLQL